MLHPEFPVAEGEYQMTEEWFITLDQKYNRRVEDGSLVIWRPGFTIWINVWSNSDNATIKERLDWIKSDSSSEAFDISFKQLEFGESYAYRLNEAQKEKVVYSYNGFVLSADSNVQASIYFDAESDLRLAKNIFESFKYVQP